MARRATAFGIEIAYASPRTVDVPEPAVHPAWLGLPNVVLTPHMGSATDEIHGSMAALAARNVVAVLTGLGQVTPVLA